MNTEEIKANGDIHSVERPCLWLGHLLGATPKPWENFQVPGLILNAYQMIQKIDDDFDAIDGILRRFDGVSSMIDSGGYYFLKEPNTLIDMNTLAEIYRRSSSEIVVSLDIPPYPKLSDSQRKARWKRTKKNAYQLDDMLDERPFMPVVHGYTKRDLKQNANEIDDLIHDSGMIGYGGIVPLLKVKRNRTFELVRYLRELYPDRFLHVFGVGSVSTMMLLALLGVDSMDTIGWRIKAAYGAIQLPGTSDRFVTPSEESSKSRRGLSSNEKELLSECNCPICRDLSLDERLLALDNADSSTFQNRAVHNCWVFTRQAEKTQSALKEGILLDILEKRMSEGYWSNTFQKVKELIGAN